MASVPRASGASGQPSQRASQHARGTTASAGNGRRRGNDERAASTADMLPANPQAERGLVASMLIYSADFGDYTDIELGDFSEPAHQLIWGAMRKLHAARQGIDVMTVVDALYQDGTLGEAGGQVGVSGRTHDVPTHLNAPHYAATVRRIAKQRKLIALYQHGFTAAFSPDCQPDILAAEIGRKVQEQLAISMRDEQVRDAREVMGMQIPPMKWLVPDLVPEGLVILASKQKIGKSWLALSLCLGTASGGVVLGGKQVGKGSALYLALEDNWRRLQERMDLLMAHDEMPAGLTLAIEWPRLDMGGLDKIEGWLRSHPDARLVAIDVLGKVRPPQKVNGDQYREDYEVMTSLKRLADTYHITLLVLHHTSKAKADDVFDEVRGSTGLTGAADATIVLQRDERAPEGVLHLTGRDVEDEKYAMLFQSGYWTLIGHQETVARSQERRDVIEFLRGEPDQQAPVRDIAQYLERHIGAVKKLLSRMASDGEVYRLARGLYGLSPTPAAPKTDDGKGDA